MRYRCMHCGAEHRPADGLTSGHFGREAVSHGICDDCLAERYELGELEEVECRGCCGYVDHDGAGDTPCPNCN